MHTARPVTPPALLTLLKESTRDQHARAESLVRLMEPGVTRDAYRRHLEALHGVWAPLEPALHARLGAALPTCLSPRLGLLETDLRALGVAVRPAHRGSPRAPLLLLAAPTQPDLGPALLPASDAGAWGALYVLEGSALGGQVLARHLERALGPSLPLAFFRGAGEDVGARWRAFCRALDAHVPAGEADALVQGARATFERFHASLAAAA